VKRGRIIFVNGTTSCGKSSLCKAMQEALLPEAFMLVGIDAIWGALPASLRPLLKSGDHIFVPRHSKDPDGKVVFDGVPGPTLTSLYKAGNRGILAMLESGVNIVSDQFWFTREWRDDALAVFSNVEVIVIGVHVSDAEGARRELRRPEKRQPGWNRGGARLVHRDMLYDLELDLTTLDPWTAARTLVARIAALPRPTAWAAMRRRLDQCSATSPRDIAASTSP